MIKTHLNKYLRCEIPSAGSYLFRLRKGWDFLSLILITKKKTIRESEKLTPETYLKDEIC